MLLKDIIQEVYDKYKNDLSGEVSTSIPALSHTAPDQFAISIATVNGKVINIGDHTKEFTIQSISKPFSYALALEQYGNDFIEEKVGMEPTGEDYDSIIKLDDKGRPFNPMVNSGAIVVSSLINKKRCKTRVAELVNYYSSFAGRKLKIDQAVYESERHTGEKNWAIAHLLRHFKVMNQDLVDNLELYFNQCSVKVNANDLAMMGATLANKGINPLTNKKCLSRINLRHVLSIIFTCGMYNYSGEWAFDIGLPAKSGISGGILMIVPGLMAISVYSPRLDRRGNSVRGIKVCEDLSNRLKLHILDYAGPNDISDLL